MATKQMLIGTVFPEPTEPFVSDSKSIDFNGSDEEMRNTTAQTIGIANAWSFMMWLNRNFIFLDTGSLFELQGANSVFSVQDRQGAMNVTLEDSGGTLFKDYKINPADFGLSEWRQMIVTWDGTDLDIYDNGVLLVPQTKTVDDAGTMANTSREVLIGSASGSLFYSGLIHSAALWDVDITSAVTEIFNSGVATTFDLKAASFAADLQHWWRLGQVSSDIGKDSGNGTLIDVDANSVNIDASDISSDSPS